MNKINYTFIDLFAGAGGLAEGFLKKKCDPLAFVEMEKDACLTLKTRLAYYYLQKNNKSNIYDDYLIGKISRDELYKAVPQEIIDSVINCEVNESNINGIFTRIHSILKKSCCKKIDIIVGGPPCQAYSLAGRSADKDRKKYDSRNLLYKIYAKFLKEFQPSLFVFENVPGLLSANEGRYYKNLKKYFRRIGYLVDEDILDASDFGVLQKRKRVLLVGWQKGLKIGYPSFDKETEKIGTGELFFDLPFLKAGESRRVCKYTKDASEYLISSGIRNGRSFVTQHISRPHNTKDQWIYGLAIDLLEKNGHRLRNSEIPEEKRTQKNITSFLDRFKVVAKDQLSHTILAHIAKDGHYYIHPDKKQLRSLSVREAARIQSFPDDYFFEGSRTSVFRQIGNAVPVMMAEKIAEKIKEILSNGY
ncbi:MAG: DNA cytosine methyltransferase [Candidatus Margulisiibacteriota bacterium]